MMGKRISKRNQAGVAEEENLNLIICRGAPKVRSPLKMVTELVVLYEESLSCGYLFL